MNDTIFALSSGRPPAGIAVIRVSGPQADAALAALAGEPLPPPRMLTLRSLRDAGGDLLDQALVVRFAKGASVTGESLAELHLHGGRATVDAVERSLALLPGLRAARPGEFTWRAFENGKADLIEVESLSDLLRAETEGQRRAAIAAGGLSERVGQWRSDILLVSALVEAQLDQSDEDDVPGDDPRARELLVRLRSEIAAVLAQPPADRLFDGVRVVFAGPPNSGKSSLINALIGRDIAITSPIAGTTRDVIEASVQIGGIAFVLTDTAGLRNDSGDEIERVGIDRAKQRMAEADIIVWMDDDDPPEFPHAAVIRVIARADLPGRTQLDGLIRVSSKTGEGLAALSQALGGAAAAMLPREGDIALGRRQRTHLIAVADELALSLLETDELILAERLRACRMEFDALVGRTGTEDMLDALFGAFCLGK